MRRYQPAVTMASKQRHAYELLGKPSQQPVNPQQSRKAYIIKALASVVVTCFLISVIHSLVSFTPKDHVFGLMIDAGSTGSRIHTFTFRQDRDSPKMQVLYEDFYALKPGLSHYKDSPADAAKSLEPLLARARTIIPAALRPHTPVVLRATAGLRMTGEKAAKAILTDVRSLLHQSGFRFDSDSWASILAGNEEGIYTWITVNYLLDRDPQRTVGTLEMGGGSAQAAYVPRDQSFKASSGNCSMTTEELTYKGSQVDLYTTSHLDFGLQKARALFFEKVQAAAKMADNPCFNKGAPVRVPMPFDATGAQLSFTGSGDFIKCRDMVDQLLVTPAMGNCDCDVCTYKGASQPRAIPEYITLAFYRERTASIGMKTPMTMQDVMDKGVEVCQMSVDEVNKAYPDVPNGVATDLCLDLAYITLHLERGQGIPVSSPTKLMAMDKIRNFELGWCLGAMQQTMAQLYK